MSEQKKKKLVDELVKYHELKVQGSQSSDQASAANAHQNIKSITIEVSLYVLYADFLVTDHCFR